MTTNSDILTLAQWLSPAFPVGAFAHSHGLETAISAGMMNDKLQLKDWLIDILAHGSGHNDAILIYASYASTSEPDLKYVNETAIAFAASAERQQEMLLQGAAFSKTAAAVWGGTAHALAYPVAVGNAAAQRQLDPSLTAAMYLLSVASNLIAAAQRLMPLGQTDGQMILASLGAICEDTARAAADLTLDSLQSTAFLSDIASMRHETLQPRIFRT